MNNGIEASTKNLGSRNNVSFRVLDAVTGDIIQEVVGHNSATNSMLQGIAHYLLGDGTFNQGVQMLSRYIPKYISLGTLGLVNQECDSDGLPLGIGNSINVGKLTKDKEDAEAALAQAEANLNSVAVCAHGEILSNGQIVCRCYDTGFECSICNDEERKNRIRDAKGLYDEALKAYQDAVEAEKAEIESQESKFFKQYLDTCPGYGADGYDDGSNNHRGVFGLGPIYKNRPDQNHSVKCELISDKFPRAKISFRQIIPEIHAELPNTVDVVFSAMISTGALSQFREPGKDYIFITEAGLWSKPNYVDGGDNGLLAAYRIVPTDSNEMDMDVPENRLKLKKSILRVGPNQVVQVIWKIQLGALSDLGSDSDASSIADEIYGDMLRLIVGDIENE